LEVGPGAVLTGLVKRIDRDAVTASAGDLGSLSAALDNGWTTSLKGER
jgi:malonyl CoA-acyl carrier protein transacylase